MPRRSGVPKRDVLPDPVYNSKVVAKLINQVMLDGKKGIAQAIVYEAFDMVAENSAATRWIFSPRHWKTSNPCWKSKLAAWADRHIRCLWK